MGGCRAVAPKQLRQNRLVPACGLWHIPTNLAIYCVSHPPGWLFLFGNMTTTLLLDRETWDLVLDASGNIAVASRPYSIVQDVASAIRVFASECYYNTSLGLPYLKLILGRSQSSIVFKAQAENAALTIAGVEAAKCVITAISPHRQLSGYILLSLSDGTTQNVGF